MNRNSEVYLLLISICLINAVVTGCSRKVRLSYSGASLVSKPVDWGAVKSKSDDYSRQNQEAVRQWLDSKNRNKPTDQRLLTRTGEIPLSIDASKVPEFDLFDKIHLAESITVKNGLRKDTAGQGVGIPLVGRIPYSGKSSMIPKRGLWMPITASLLPGIDRAVIQVIDPTVNPRFQFNKQPASFDLTAPLALDIRNRQKDFQRLKALVNYDKFIPQSGMNRLFGFSAEKTPVILVHGIFSASTTWNNTINELLADPVVRQNYEFWTYGYPTGAPIPYLAYRLRESVNEVIEYRKARGADQQVILFGHSMGGLMSKTLTQSSGYTIWDQLFSVRPEDLPVSSVDRKLWKGLFVFEPIPEVNRIVFIATPHKGAKGASSAPGKVMEKLIRLPKKMKQITGNLTAHAECLTPLGRQLFADFPNSMRHMQKGSEMGDLLAMLPLNQTVRYHSYIGSKKGVAVPTMEMTDGVVERSSASIPNVESELIVHSGHGVHNNEMTIVDMKRVLIENLQ